MNSHCTCPCSEWKIVAWEWQSRIAIHFYSAASKKKKYKRPKIISRARSSLSVVQQPTLFGCQNGTFVGVHPTKICREHFFHFPEIAITLSWRFEASCFNVRPCGSILA